MWNGYRRWKAGIVPVLLSSASSLIVLNAEDSGLWRVGVVLVAPLMDQSLWFLAHRLLAGQGFYLSTHVFSLTLRMPESLGLGFF